MWTVMDEGSNIRKACLEDGRMEWVPCMTHVVQRAVMKIFGMVKKGRCIKKLVGMSSLMHRSE